MKRTYGILHAGVAFAAIATATGCTSAECPASRRRGDPACGSVDAAPSSQADIVITGSRIRRNPLDLDAPRVFIDQSDIAKTGLNSISDVLQRLPSSGGGLNSKFNNSGNLGNPPDGGGVGAGSAEIDLRYSARGAPWCSSTASASLTRAAASGVPGSVDLNSIPDSDD